MSSTPYSTELNPDPRLRQFVLVSSALLHATGVAVIALLPVPAHWRWLGAALWAVAGLREIHSVACGFRQCRRIRIDSSGATELLREQGEWTAAEIQTGSVVLNRFAWLRLRLADGSRCVELLQGNTRDNEAWRRFQLIWRHLGGAR